MAKSSFFDKPIRTYTVDGHTYPSVTEVLSIMDKSGPLMGWCLKECGNFILDETDNLYRAAIETTEENDLFVKTLEKTVKLAKGAHRSKSKKALDVGSRVHEIVHDLGLGKIVDMSGDPEQVINGVTAYLSWVEQTGYVGKQHELIVYSHDLEIAGTLDDIGQMQERLALLDWKTSKALYDEYLIQAAVYAHCYEEMFNCKIDEAWIVRFDKETGVPEERLVENREAHVKCFRGLRAAWQWKQDAKRDWA